MLHIYNTLTKQKSPFTPLTPGEVKLYVCGMTVYDYCHIGHARSMLVFDLVVRYLRHLNYRVTYVRNITDIDDKIIQRAQENKEDMTSLTTRFIQAMHEDFTALHILAPDREPRATEYIAHMIGLIETLIAKKYAYIGPNGDVYYAIQRFSTYGELAHQDIEKLRAGARVSIADAKNDPLDFVLWKMAKPGEPSWDSPWGKGRPGWHIECSAMSLDCLGEQFDIHGGGFDLIFPHHQNEIAQSEGATGKTFVHTWMHVGFVTINKEKMSKSLNNFFTIREVLENYPAEVVRYFMLSSHYRSQLNYSRELLDQAKAGIERFYLALRGLPAVQPDLQYPACEKFHVAMQDDFNTPEAIAALFELAHDIQKARQQNQMAQAATLGATLQSLANILGILQLSPEDFLQAGDKSVDVAQIEKLLEVRQQAKQEKNWARADEIRQQLFAQGIIVEDEAQGSTWRYK